MEAGVASAVRVNAGLVHVRTLAVDGAGSHAETILEGEGDAGGGVLFHLSQGNENVAVHQGAIEVEAGIDVAAARNGHARITARLPAGVIDVLHLDTRRCAQQVARLPVGCKHRLFERPGAAIDALQQTDSPRAGSIEQVHDSADHGGVNPLRYFRRIVTETPGSRPRKIDFDRDGLVLHQRAQAAQPVEQGLKGGYNFRPICFRTCDRHTLRRACPGRTSQGAHGEKQSPTGEVQLREWLFHVDLPPVF